MIHVFLMDPIATVNPSKDTTFFLMKACAERGHDVLVLNFQDIWLDHNKLYGNTTKVIPNEKNIPPFEKLAGKEVCLSSVDVIWIRNNPPVDRQYFYMTLLLDYIASEVRIINHPRALRDWNEKLATLFFPSLTPETLVTRDVSKIHQMVSKCKKIVVKPIDGFGGKGIFFHQQGDSDYKLKESTQNGSRWVVAQRFLPESQEGDKRILLVNGNPIGAILRLNVMDHALNNLDMGAKAYPSSLSDRDVSVCNALQTHLVKAGLFFVGIDMIGGWLTEINVTSPTGLQEMSRFDQIDYHHMIIKELEQK